MNWLSGKLAKIPMSVLLIVSVFMLVAPVFPEPHLIQKLQWIRDGVSFKWVDIFDVIWHVFPCVFLVLKLGLAKAD